MASPSRLAWVAESSLGVDVENSSLAESPAGSAEWRGVVLQRQGLSPATNTYGMGRERWCWSIALWLRMLPVPSESLPKAPAEQLL